RLQEVRRAEPSHRSESGEPIARQRRSEKAKTGRPKRKDESASNANPRSQGNASLRPRGLDRENACQGVPAVYAPGAPHSWVRGGCVFAPQNDPKRCIEETKKLDFPVFMRLRGASHNP